MEVTHDKQFYNPHLRERWEVNYLEGKITPTGLGQGPGTTSQEESGMGLTDNRQKTGKVNVSTQRKQTLCTCLGHGWLDFVSTAKGRSGRLHGMSAAPSASQLACTGAILSFHFTLIMCLSNLIVKTIAPNPILTVGKKRFKVLESKYQMWKVMKKSTNLGKYTSLQL